MAITQLLLTLLAIGHVGVVRGQARNIAANYANKESGGNNKAAGQRKVLGGSLPTPPLNVRPTTARPSTRRSVMNLRTGPLANNVQVAASLTNPPPPPKLTTAPPVSSGTGYFYYDQAGQPIATVPPLPPPPPKFVEGNAYYEWETLLVRKLFNKRRYNPQVRPAVSDQEPVEVSVELVLLQINEMIEKDQEIVVSGFIKIKWHDARLRWDSSDYNGIDWIVTESTNCWLPDLALINSNDVYAVTRDTRFPLTLNASGDILYVPAGKIYARCELNLRFFPFDYQLCKYRFESWAYASELVRITGLNFTIEPEHYMQNPEWQIPDAFVRTEIVHYESYNFSRVDFFMLLKRKSLFFITYTIFPCVALSVLQLMSHMLPFTEPERINFATTTLIAFSVFHVSIVEQMPHSSDSIPLLAIFVDALMCLIGLSLIECFLMMNWLSKVGLTVPSPRMWYYLVDRWGDFLGLGSAGNYWRSNYIYVYERLNHKLDVERRRRELERQRWASVAYQYKMRRSSRGIIGGFGSSKEDANLEALLFLIQRREHSPRGSIIPPPPPPAISVPNDEVTSNNSGNAVPPRSLQIETSASRHTLLTNSFNYHGNSEHQPLLAGRKHKVVPGNNISHMSKYNSTVLGSSSESLPLAVAAQRKDGSRKNSVCAADLRHHRTGKATSPSNSWKKNKRPTGTRRRQHQHPAACNPATVTPFPLNPAAIPNHHGRCAAMHFGDEIRPRSRSLLRAALHGSVLNNSNDEHIMSKSAIVGDNQPSESTAETSLINLSPMPSIRSPNPNIAAIATSVGNIANAGKVPPKSPTLTSEPVQLLSPMSNSPNRLKPTPADSPMLTERSVSFTNLGGVANRNGSIDETNPRNSSSHDPFLDKIDKKRVEDIRNFVEEISTHITNHELKKECIGVWTIYITVVDRILSIFLCLLSFSLLFYLFYLFPEPPNVSRLRGGQSMPTGD